MMDPEKELKYRKELAGCSLFDLIRQLAGIHMGDGDELGVLAEIILARLHEKKRCHDEEI